MGWIDLPAVQAEMDGCRICLDKGYEITPRAVYSGASSASMMVVGQAPGITEAEVGRPFNAGSGSRLFGWLLEAGIEENWFRSTQYMTSVTKCYPGRSAGGSGDRVPSKKEQTYCRPYLEAEIRFVDPLIVLPVGRLAINQFFSGNPPLTEIIGSKTERDGRAIIPLPHPSGASRWHQIDENRARIARAVELVGDEARKRGILV